MRTAPAAGRGRCLLPADLRRPSVLLSHLVCGRTSQKPRAPLSLEGQIKRCRVFSLDKKVLTLHIASKETLVSLRCVSGMVPAPVEWAKQHPGLLHILRASVPGTEPGVWDVPRRRRPSPVLGPRELPDLTSGRHQGQGTHSGTVGWGKRAAAEETLSDSALCITRIHSHSHFWPHEIRVLFLGFIPAF